MPVSKIRYTTLVKAGSRIRVPADRDFYIQTLFNSQFHGRIATAWDRKEALRTRRGFPSFFTRDQFYEAAGLCIYAHRDQTRKISGEPYAVHPITLAERMIDLLNITDEEMLLAALLHDVDEDTDFNLAFIKRRFGTGVARLVDGLTMMEEMEQDSDRLISEANINKFVDALSRDIRVLPIKMADRGINLEDAERFDQAWRKRKCGEALDFYVPLGVLCGFMKAARHLSDIAFKKLAPERYAEVEAARDTMVAENSELLDLLSAEIGKRWRKRVGASLPPFLSSDPVTRRYFAEKVRSLQILSKPRTVYEVEQVATMRGTDARDLSDVVMMQILVDSEADCYSMIPIVHSLGIPFDAVWHDFIEDSKINRYQSLHTGILYGRTLIRFQIRTRRMQRVAQEGVLWGSYTPSGKFRQPSLPWLKAEWIKIIRGVSDRREKIALTRSLSQARRANVLVEGRSMRHDYEDVLLPPGISPLEAAIITDPRLALHLDAAYHHDIPREVDEPIDQGRGAIKLRIADEVQHRDYFRSLESPLARWRLIEHFRAKGTAYAKKFFGAVLQKELDGVFLKLEDLAADFPEEIDEILGEMARGKLSASAALLEIQDRLRENGGSVVALERLELEGERVSLETVASVLQTFSLAESVAFSGERLRLSVSVRHRTQATHLSRFLNALEILKDIRLVAHQSFVPPVIDDLVLNPDTLYYSHDIAQRVARALHAQAGRVIDISLKPHLSLQKSSVLDQLGMSAILFRHIEDASVLFLGGEKNVTEQFRQELEKIVCQRRNISPLFVVFERKYAADAGRVLAPIRDVPDFPISLGITASEHHPDFLLNLIAGRLGVAR